MSNESAYQPPKVWKWEDESGGRWGSVNRPIAGATFEKELPVGKHPFQLYSLATPNGVKVTIMLEELLAMGIKEAEYDAWLINIAGDQFGSGFVDINPNSKIPALVDRSGDEPFRVFESGAILMHLAEKFDALIPKDPALRAECLSWVFWSIGSTPYVGGGFNHFYSYAPEKNKYAIDRFTMETKRLMDLLDRHLADKQWMCGDEYSIADIIIWPWFGSLVNRNVPGGIAEVKDFLDVDSYKNLVRWSDEFWARPTVKRGRMVNMPIKGNLAERHDASDFELKLLEENLVDPRPQDKEDKD